MLCTGVHSQIKMGWREGGERGDLYNHLTQSSLKNRQYCQCLDVYLAIPLKFILRGGLVNKVKPRLLVCSRVSEGLFESFIKSRQFL